MMCTSRSDVCTCRIGRDQLSGKWQAARCGGFVPSVAAGSAGDSARQISGRSDAAWGVYHAAGTGDVTWCGLAREVFAVSARHGGPTAKVKAITTAEYPTPARRPANSRLDCSQLAALFGVRLPAWQEGVDACVTALARESTRPA